MEARPPLTAVQSSVLDTIRDSIRERGYPPTLREVGTAVGLASTSTVAHALQVLQARGYLVRDPGSPRALRIVDDPDAPTDASAVDALAQQIRLLDGNHVLGAGALAEALMPWVVAYAENRCAGAGHGHQG